MSHSHDILRLVPRSLKPFEFGKGQDLSAPVPDPVPAVGAATVVVLDEVDGQVCTWLMQRHARMPFAPNMVVYPGGVVDPVDEIAPDPVKAAAVRELAEEADLHITVEDLVPWARWVTPTFHTKRYDTWFYLARMPVGQTARDISGEADRAGWMTISDALAGAARDELRILPPTWSVLRELSDYPGLDAILAAGVDRVVEPVLSRLARDGDGYRWVYPGDEDY